MSSPIPPVLSLAITARNRAQSFASFMRYALVSCLCMSLFVFQAHASNQDTESAQATNSGKFDFSKVPPVTPMPRLGLFGAPPSGPGYYSIKDLVTGNKRENRPSKPYAPFALMPTSAFDVDFRYLENPEHEKNLFDPVKRIHLGNDWLLSFGGSFWYRYVHETDSRLNASDTNNDWHMLRTRVHADLWYRDRVRLFAEFLDARAFGGELSPLGIERNHADMLNLFADIKLADANGPIYFRAGRQELIYGSQRLISTLDWANTRRTFQGGKVFWRNQKFDLDAFWVRPMKTQLGEFDNWDTQQNFWGLWGSIKPMPGHLIDLYYLGLDNQNPVSPANVAIGNIMGGNFSIHTWGGRLVGNFDRYLYELEGMYQWGERSNLDVSAFAVATGLGYRVPLPMNPHVWIRYDFASGDANPNDGRSNTFSHLFPFGHYYMGFMDRVGRQNIHDINAQITMHPVPWFTFISQYHRYYLANDRDYLYNAGGAAALRDPTGQSGSHVGDEIDFRANIHISRNHDVLVGYSKLFSGKFLKAQRPGTDADLFYVQYNFRF